MRCLRCGSCCRWEGYVYLREEDVARLAKVLGLSEGEFVNRYTRLAPDRARLVLEQKSNGECVFLDGRDCLVYEARPYQCRTFGETWTLNGCPGYRGDAQTEVVST